MTEHDAFPRVGGHPAIDFLNTAYEPHGVRIETLTDGAAFLDWLVEFGLLDRETARALIRRHGRPAIDATAAEARRVREWARNWLSRWHADPGADQARELRELNRLLARHAPRREVHMGDDGLTMVEHASIDSAEALIGLVAAPMAELVTREDPERIDTCAGPGCTLWFFDRTKAVRRRYCTATGCGNRAKVAAFRERQRAQ